MKLSKAPGFNKEDAAIVAAIPSEIDTTDEETRKATIVRLKNVYDRNLHAMKKNKQIKMLKT